MGIRHITVAVSFDDRLDDIVTHATTLARTCGARLRLLHALDVWEHGQYIGAAGASDPKIAEDIQTTVGQTAQQRLALLASTIDRDLAVETALATGESPEVICDDARTSGTDLIVIGAHRGLTGTAMAGISSAVSVVAESTVPVLIVNETAPRTFGPQARILVADDLSANGLAAMTTATDLAIPLGALLIHAHVSHSENAHRREALTATLRDRAKSLSGALESRGGRYVTDVAYGSVTQELERIACAGRAHIAVFGRHHTYHKSPARVGQMPFKAMFGSARLAVVVPDRSSP